MQNKIIQWKVLFSEEELSEAQQLVSQGKAKNAVETDTGYSVRVRTDRNYLVEINTDEAYDDRNNPYECIYEVACSCEKGTLNHRCIHAAAAFLLIEQEFKTELWADPEAIGWPLDNLHEILTQTERGNKNSSADGTEHAAITAAGSSRKKVTASGNAAQNAERQKAADDEAAKKLQKTLPLLTDLMDARSKEREQDDGGTGEPGYQTHPYHLFYLDDIESGLHISAYMYKEAQKLIENGMVRIVQFRLERGRDLPYVYSDIKPNDRIGSFYLYAQDDNSYCYDRPFRVNMYFSPHTLVYSQCEGWYCNTRRSSNSYYGRTLCKHEVAGILLFRDFITNHPELDSTTREAGNLIHELARTAGTSLTSLKDLKGEFLRLEPQLEVLDDNVLQCAFRVGTSKLYKIKNLHDFHKAMKQGQSMPFGTRTLLQLGENLLTEEAEPWYRFLSEAMEEENLRYRRYAENYYVPVSTDGIELGGELLDRFLAMAVGTTLAVSIRTENERGKKNWEVRNQPLDVRLKIEPDMDKNSGEFEGIRITGRLPEVYQGLRTACYADETHLNMITEEEKNRLAPLIRCAGDNGRIDLKVGRYHLADFYHKALPELKKIAKVSETNGKLIEAYLPPEPSFIVYLDVENSSLLCRAEAEYGKEIFSVSDVIDAEQGRIYEQYRDRKTEQEIVAEILRYFPKYDAEMKIFFTDRDEEAVYEFLDHGMEELSQRCDVRVTDRFRRLGLRRHVRFDVGIQLESNLLDLEVTAQDLSEEEMLQVLYQYQRRRRFVRLKNGDFIKLEDNESIRQIVQMMDAMHLSVKDVTKGKMHLPAYRALYLDKMLEGQEDLYADRDRHFKQLIKEFKTVADSDYEVPQHLKSIMRSYQKEGYRWLRTLDHYGFGGILADEMGLGKTLQMLAVLEAVKKEEAEIQDRTHTSLVVCPASLVYNWLEEAHRFAPSLKAVAVTGTASVRAGLIHDAESADVLITSYDLLKRDIAEYDSLQFRFEVLDEAQYIKTHTTAAAKSVKLVHAMTRFALTGTPIENHLSELWSIFDYLMPVFLFAYDNFRAQIETPIVKNQDPDIEERLRKMIAPFILRRRKQDVLKDLPEKLEEIRYAGMEGRQQKLYDAQVIRMRRDISGQDENDFRRSKIQILAELMKIRQICCDPSLLYTNYDGTSAKTELCMELLHSLTDGGHKTLVFSQFTSMLEILRERLDKEKISYYEITGSTPKEQRLDLVNQFNTDDTPVFLISLKAGGTGLNLVGADSVIHFDPWWNTAAEDQASDRAHRIGQKKVVTVYKLVVKGTIEEKIIDLQQQKAKLANDILGGEGMADTSFTREDLLNILT